MSSMGCIWQMVMMRIMTDGPCYASLKDAAQANALSAPCCPDIQIETIPAVLRLCRGKLSGWQLRLLRHSTYKLGLAGKAAGHT